VQKLTSVQQIRQVTKQQTVPTTPVKQQVVYISSALVAYFTEAHPASHTLHVLTPTSVLSLGQATARDAAATSLTRRHRQRYCVRGCVQHYLHWQESPGK